MAVSVFNEGNLSGAIKGVDDKVGALSSLTTTDKTDIVSAVNELNTRSSVSSPVSWGSAYATGDDPVAYMFKCGKIRVLTLNFLPKNANADWTTVCTVSSGNRPASLVTAVAVGTSTDVQKSMRLQQDGSCEIYNRTVNAFRATFVYLV